MAEIDVDKAEGGEEAKPKPRPKPAKPASGGSNMMTIIIAAVAVAAIAVCGLLAWQMMQLQAKLGDANIKTPAGLGGDEAAAAEEEGGDGHADGHGGGADGEYTGGWEDDPETFKFPMAKFTAKTADGKAAVITLALMATSGVTYRDAENFKIAQEKYVCERHTYDMNVKAWLEENAIHTSANDRQLPSYFSHDNLVVGGFFLMHGGPTAAEWPEEPVEPDPPKTILEQKILEREDEVREVIIDEINERTATELNTRSGRDHFKVKVLDRLNVMFTRFVGEFNSIVVSDIIST